MPTVVSFWKLWKEAARDRNAPASEARQRGRAFQKGNVRPVFQRGSGFSVQKWDRRAEPSSQGAYLPFPLPYRPGVTAVSSSTGIPPLLDRKAGRSGRPVRLAS